ncbi:MAG: alpha/beta hydrolase [Planctomycetes bacterium]|nr:alpha/beta hydrolase [Planctomycetota bacterium]
MRRTPIYIVLLLLATTGRASVAQEAAHKGTVKFQPTAGEQALPEHFQLKPHTFTYEFTPGRVLLGRIATSTLTFPSPVKTPHENNNTVHCEYYRPLGAKGDRDKKQPGVIVLHILGGNFALSRLFCTSLASRGVSALFVKLPYYGPRRQPGVSIRMISEDPHQTVRGMTQGVLDIRRAVAWLGQQEEVDSKQLGIFGISLGGITASLAATAEPRLTKICPLLAGGDIAQIAWESPQMAKVRKRWIKQGGTRQTLVELMKTIDPVTYGKNVRGRKILMLNARNDEVIPRSCTDALWRSFGKPEIIWYDAGHYTAIKHINDCLRRVSKFFQPEKM